MEKQSMIKGPLIPIGEFLDEEERDLGTPSTASKASPSSSQQKPERSTETYPLTPAGH